MSEVEKSTPKPIRNARYYLNRLSAVTSTLSGLDAALMIPQYSTPVVIFLLLKLARLRAGRLGLSPVTQQKLAVFAAALGRGASSLSEARTIMRLFGSLPMIQWLLALHPNPLASLRNLILAPHKLNLGSAKTISTIQCLSLLVYYPLEHLGWLSGKGIVPLTPTRTGQAILWSVRAWAIYVMLDIYKLSQAYTPLQQRTKAITAKKSTIDPSAAEGYELQETEKAQSGVAVAASGPDEKQTLSQDWRKWRLAVMQNIGYGPLTVHWSTGGLWAEPAITGVLGVLAATSKFITVWEQAGAK